jgi:hypothetical protein
VFKFTMVAAPRNLLPCFAALAACTPPPQEAAMHNNPGPVPVTAAHDPDRIGTIADRAALGPNPAPVSAAENPVPAAPADASAAVEGRRILSTAFVMVGPGGHLTIALHSGASIVLRDVVMRRADYCGVQLRGGRPGARYCGSYADVAAARPGDASMPDAPQTGPSNPGAPTA